MMTVSFKTSRLGKKSAWKTISLLRPRKGRACPYPDEIEVRHRQSRRSHLKVLRHSDGVVLHKRPSSGSEDRVVRAGEEHRAELLRGAEAIARS